MTTATKESKSKRSRTKIKADEHVSDQGESVAVGNPPSTDSPEKSGPALYDRLALLGFVIETDDDLTEAELVTAREWLDGKDFPATDVPEFLRDYEGVDAPLMQVALDAGKAKGQAGASENTCPYPPGTIMRAYWTDGFKDGMLAKEAARKADFEARKQLAIEDAQSRMESAVESQREYRKQWNHLKSRLKSVKQDYEDAVEEAQEAYEELQNARDGNLPAQRPLPFKDDKPAVPDQDIGGPAAPLPEDHGGKMDLNCLKKGEVQKQTGCRDDIGLSNKQIESLKEQIGGSTIAALEKFQREHQDWNRELDGFGEERITQLQDAHLEIRKTFPIPTIEQAVVDAAANAINNGSMPGVTAETTNVTMTPTQAVHRLQKLVARAGDVADECDNPDGVKFCESVAEEAGKVCDTILSAGAVTIKQLEAIANWEVAVEGWASDVDELEDDLP